MWSYHVLLVVLLSVVFIRGEEQQRCELFVSALGDDARGSGTSDEPYATLYMAYHNAQINNMTSVVICLQPGYYPLTELISTNNFRTTNVTILGVGNLPKVDSVIIANENSVLVQMTFKNVNITKISKKYKQVFPIDLHIENCVVDFIEFVTKNTPDAGCDEIFVKNSILHGANVFVKNVEIHECSVLGSNELFAINDGTFTGPPKLSVTIRATNFSEDVGFMLSEPATAVIDSCLFSGNKSHYQTFRVWGTSLGPTHVLINNSMFINSPSREDVEVIQIRYNANLQLNNVSFSCFQNEHICFPPISMVSSTISVENVTLDPSCPWGCPIGSVSNNMLFECTLCADGSFSNTTINATCTPCPPGTWTRDSDRTSCVPCGPGKYRLSGMNGCEWCDAGYIQPSLITVNQCIPCDTGKSSNYDRTSCVPCPPGTYSISGSPCLSCDDGTVSPDYGTSNCSICSKGQTNNWNHTQCIDCIPGYFNAHDGGTCMSCDIGSIAPETGSTSCSTCGQGYTSNDNHTRCFTCSPGYFNGDEAGVCIPCAPGSYGEGWGSKSCKHCPVGSFSKEWASTQCTACLSGQYQPRSNQTSCLLCPPGHFSSPTLETCQQCSIGSLTINNGDYTICIDCAPGTFKHPNVTVCLPCPPGTYSHTRSSSCTPCPPGTYQPQTLGGSCLYCDGIPNNDATQCLPCSLWSVGQQCKTLSLISYVVITLGLILIVGIVVGVMLYRQCTKQDTVQYEELPGSY